MCGICGFTNFNNTFNEVPARLKRMNDLIIHRGPDDEGSHIEPDSTVALAMRRLSIIDLDTGHQPISNEDGTVTVVYNGEIYNYLELRDDLISKGHIFKTRTDTEVLVHLYEQYGEDCPRKLNGMFAFVIHDRKNGILFGARDHVGIKPFIYTFHNGEFLFASELRSITAGLPKKPEINSSSLKGKASL